MKKFIIFTLMLAYAWSAQSQIFNPVKWSFNSKHLSGDKFELIYTASIDDGWTIYSQYLESEDGPVATTFEYDQGDHFSLNNKNKEDALNRKEGYDKIFDMNVTKYTKKAIFRQKVKVNDYTKPVTGYLTFMTCDASKCLPPKDIDFKFRLRPIKAEPIQIVEDINPRNKIRLVAHRIIHLSQ